MVTASSLVGIEKLIIKVKYMDEIYAAVSIIMLSGYQGGSAQPLTGRKRSGWFKRILSGGGASKY